MADFQQQDADKARPILPLAEKFGLLEDEFEPVGRFKGKVHPEILQRLAKKEDGKYILVTAMTPTPWGEGKTVNTIGLSMALNRLGHRAIACIRQPSMGPVFGAKGGGAGGGRAKILPLEDINLHLTGDIHAVGAAHNLLAAFIDNHIHHGNELGIDISTINWKRTVDMNDRALRKTLIGMGGPQNGVPRTSGFEVTAASEIMALLSLSENWKDLRQRLGNIVFGLDYAKQALRAEDLKCAGAMAAILRDTLMPTMAQTSEYTPCFLHSGPFANIATGNSSILADRIALKLADYVVTEAGFGAEMGAEKFFHIKCRASGLKPNAAALIASIRAIKSHGLGKVLKPGGKIPKVLGEENPEALKRGFANLGKQIENLSQFGIPIVLALNRMEGESEKEEKMVLDFALEQGARAAVISEVFQKGGNGGLAFAKAIEEAAASGATHSTLYDENATLAEQLEILSTKLYGADGFDLSSQAQETLTKLQEAGMDKMPVCVAKTQFSLSHNPQWLGRPSNWTLPITEFRVSAGAGFVTAYAGDIQTMPGLPKNPGGQKIDIMDDGSIIGLT